MADSSLRRGPRHPLHRDGPGRPGEVRLPRQRPGPGHRGAGRHLRVLPRVRLHRAVEAQQAASGLLGIQLLFLFLFFRIGLLFCIIICCCCCREARSSLLLQWQCFRKGLSGRNVKCKSSTDAVFSRAVQTANISRHRRRIVLRVYAGVILTNCKQDCIKSCLSV